MFLRGSSEAGNRQALLNVVPGECTDRTSLPSPFTLSSVPLIDRVCAAKACAGRETNQPRETTLRVLTRVLITLSLVKVFSFLFVFEFFIVPFIHVFLLATACHMSTLPASVNVKALVGFGTPTVQALTYLRWGLGGR